MQSINIYMIHVNEKVYYNNIKAIIIIILILSIIINIIHNNDYTDDYYSIRIAGFTIFIF